MSRTNNDIFSGEEPKEEKQIKQKKYASISSNLEWDVPVETAPLPSKGLIYDSESFFHMKETVDIKSMTAKEEDILLSAAYQKKGTALDELIKSCIGKIGVDPDDLIFGDKNALLISIRVTGYGSDYDANITCPACGDRREYRFNLTNLEINRLGAEPIEEGKNAFLFYLPVSKKKVVFKLLTGHDERKRDMEALQISKTMGINSVGAVTSNLYHSIISIDGIEDEIKIRKFVDSMPAKDSKALREYMTNIQPGIDSNVKHTCENCGHSTTVYLPFTRKFFFPD